MTAVAAHSGLVLRRHVRGFLRQPAWVVMALVQPMIWLLLFGALFRRVVEIPGFGAHGSYLDFLTPGVVVLTAVSSSGWAGMGFIEDVDGGVMDRLLVSPVAPWALNLGSVLFQILMLVLQAGIMVLVALVAGATFPGGIAGVLVLVGLACVLGGAFAALSNAFALVVRRREALIGIVTLVTLPLTFLSGAFMQTALAPGWIRTIAALNPVDWTVRAARSALAADPDWALVARAAGGLAALLVVSCALAALSLRAYRRAS